MPPRNSGCGDADDDINDEITIIPPLPHCLAIVSLISVIADYRYRGYVPLSMVLCPLSVAYVYFSNCIDSEKKASKKKTAATSAGTSGDAARDLSHLDDLNTEFDASQYDLESLRMVNELSLAYRPVVAFPSHLAKESSAHSITKIDLTECGIRRLDNLVYFSSLDCLVLDHNELESIFSIPPIPSLTTLWCNNNCIRSLNIFLMEVQEKFPRINYLSLMRNPAVPSIADSLLEEGSNSSKSESGLSNDKATQGAYTFNSEWFGKITISSSASYNNAVIQSDIADALDSIRNREVLLEHQKYRIAVISKLPTLRVLDGADVTYEEYTASREKGAGDWLMEGELDTDETSIWKWPEGYSPPTEWLRDTKKLGLIRQVQQELEDSVKKLLGRSYRELAASTYWDINKKTISRYLEASLWTGNYNGVSVCDAILETIRWRIQDKIPFSDKVLLRSGLENGMINISGCSKDGRPIMYVDFANDKLDYYVNGRCVIYAYERAVQMMSPAHQEFVLLMNMAHFGFRNMPPMSIVSEMSNLFGKHMPRRLGNVFLLNVSYVVNLVYDMVSMSLSDVTKKKFRFLSGSKEEQRRCLLEYIDEDVLASAFGGTRDVDFNVDEFLAGDPYLREGTEKPLYS